MKKVVYYNYSLDLVSFVLLFIIIKVITLPNKKDSIPIRMVYFILTNFLLSIFDNSFS